MKPDDLYNAVTDLRDEQILEGEKRLRPNRTAYARRLGAIAAMLAVLLLASVFLMPKLTRPQTTTESASPSADPVLENPTDPLALPNPSAFRLATASYPQMVAFANEKDYLRQDGTIDPSYDAAYKAWADSRSEIRPTSDYSQGLDVYFHAVLPVLLGETDAKNCVVSPMNLYLALAMLAETTAGESRQEILDLLHAADLKTLRTQANAVWRANYNDDGVITSILASSLWLRDDQRYREDTVQTLADDYYASVFSGPMGEQEYDATLRDWMNEQTGELLEDQIAGIAFDPNTVMSLVNTVRYNAPWQDPFEKTEERSFYTPTQELTTTFLTDSDFDMTCYFGEHFTAAAKPVKIGAGKMYFLLPHEGVTPEELLTQEETISFLSGEAGRSQTSHREVILTLSVPQFDVSSQLALEDSLKKLGIEKVFDPAQADFSPLMKESAPTYLSEVTHGARVQIDQEGIQAAAYTMLGVYGAAEPPQERVNLILDRPFLFVHTNSDGLPLFVGIVNET